MLPHIDHMCNIVTLFFPDFSDCHPFHNNFEYWLPHCPPNLVCLVKTTMGFGYDIVEKGYDFNQQKQYYVDT